MQSQEEKAQHFKLSFDDEDAEQNFILVNLAILQESFYGSSCYVNFVQAVLRCEWTCSDVVFEGAGFNSTPRLQNSGSIV